MASDGRCFTFQWKLKNTWCCIWKTGEEMRSPAFVVNAIEGTKWRLRFFPKGKKSIYDIGFYLRREEDSIGRDTVEIKYELAYIGEEDKVLAKSGISKRIFSRGESLGPPESSFAFLKSEICVTDRLTLLCRIWKDEGEMAKNVTCTAVTRMGMEMRSYRWDVKNFSTLESGKKINHQIKFHQNGLSRMSADLYLSEGLNTEGIIQLDLSLQDQSIKKANLHSYLIHSSGSKTEDYFKEVWFDDLFASKRLTFDFTKKYLLERKNVYLPNDTLSLRLTWIFFPGVVSEELVDAEELNICSDVKISDVQSSSVSQKSLLVDYVKIGYRSNEERSLSDSKKSLVNDFLDNVKILYDEGFLSDVKLTTATREFPAHKLMLSLCSSVFHAMFFSNTKENITNCVPIEDLDDDAVSRMLHFIYTTRVGDLTWESASNLYKAANKYDISILKSECSSFLKKDLSSTNACDLLLLADSHADTDLKAVVQDYILKNGWQITTSDEWKALMETNGTLAAKTLCNVFR